VKGWRIFGLTNEGCIALNNFTKPYRKVSVIVEKKSPLIVLFLINDKTVRRFIKEDAVRFYAYKLFKDFSCVENVDYKLEVLE